MSAIHKLDYSITFLAVHFRFLIPLPPLSLFPTYFLLLLSRPPSINTCPVSLCVAGRLARPPAAARLPSHFLLLLLSPTAK